MPNAEKHHVTIEKLVYGGEGLARIDGQVVLAPFVLPGEAVEIATANKRGGVLRGSLLNIETPSPHRIAPDCPYFSKCGGCQYQHADYAYQLEQKVEVLREVLRRIGKLEAGDIGVVSGPEWGYRNRVQLHFDNGKLGLLEAGSHRLCAIERCPIASPRLNENIAALAGMVRDRRWPRFLRSLELFTNETETQVNVLESGQPVARRFFEWCAERIPGSQAPALEYPAAGMQFRVGPRSFFQVNRHLIDELVTLVVPQAPGETALDLYAGVGLFALPLAKRFAQVTAVESGGGAVDDLRHNAERAGVQVNAVKNDTETFLASCEGPVDLVVADPPRAGMGKRVLAELNRIRPKSLVIVACDPSTLARDLAVLVASGFRIEAATLVDLFPQTYHLEVVVRLNASA
jgi:23S rRNA (uracil1939-C5)-methyltransferase